MNKLQSYRLLFGLQEVCHQLHTSLGLPPRLSNTLIVDGWQPTVETATQWSSQTSRICTNSLVEGVMARQSPSKDDWNPPIRGCCSLSMYCAALMSSSSSHAWGEESIAFCLIVNFIAQRLTQGWISFFYFSLFVVTSAIVNSLTGGFFCTAIIYTGASRMAAVRTNNPGLFAWASFSAMASCSVVARGGSVSWFRRMRGSCCWQWLSVDVGRRWSGRWWRWRMRGSCASGCPFTEGGGGGWEGVIILLVLAVLSTVAESTAVYPFLLAQASSCVASSRALAPVTTEHVPRRG